MSWLEDLKKLPKDQQRRPKSTYLANKNLLDTQLSSPSSNNSKINTMIKKQGCGGPITQSQLSSLLGKKKNLNLFDKITKRAPVVVKFHGYF